jgi:phage terminase large subunit-like protein
MLVHGEGDLLGEPYRVPAWLVRAAYRILEYDPVTFERTIRKCLIVCPKGSAKTEGMAALALFELAGPSLPSRDGPMMRPAPNIPVAAASWEQAGRLFKSAATNMCTGTPDRPAPIAPYVECFEAEIQLKGRPGSLYRVAAVAGTNDGGLPTAVFCDEIHEWRNRKERVHLILTQGLDKRRRGGLEVNITTPDDADPGSLLGRMMERARRVSSGEIDDASFYFLHYGAPAECKLDTDAEVIAAVASATPAEWANIERIAEKFTVDHLPEHEFRRYWLGQFVRAGGSWLPEGAWKALGTGEVIAAGADVVLGFDGSFNNDSTALVVVRLGDVPHVDVVECWERPIDARHDWTVPVSDVEDMIRVACDRWNVHEVVCDPARWAHSYQILESEGIPIVEFPQSAERMQPATQRFYEAVVNGLLTHSGDPRLARHIGNAVLKVSPRGVARIMKEDRHSSRKIDLAVAAVMAHERACASREVDPEVKFVNLSDYL